MSESSSIKWPSYRVELKPSSWFKGYWNGKYWDALTCKWKVHGWIDWGKKKKKTLWSCDHMSNEEHIPAIRKGGNIMLLFIQVRVLQIFMLLYYICICFRTLVFSDIFRKHMQINTSNRKPEALMAVTVKNTIF